MQFEVFAFETGFCREARLMWSKPRNHSERGTLQSEVRLLRSFVLKQNKRTAEWKSL